MLFMICRLPMALVKPDEFISNVLDADRSFSGGSALKYRESTL